VSKPLEAEIVAARARRDRTAAQLRAEDTALEQLIKAQQALISAVIEEHRKRILTYGEKNARVNYMSTIEKHTPKKLGRPILSSHPFAIRCVELYGSVKDAAKALGRHPATIRSWYADDDSWRKIPDDMKELLSKKPWLISLSSWRRS
jgi:hypothetical protein